jgi:hypothetical protein
MKSHVVCKVVPTIPYLCRVHVDVFVCTPVMVPVGYDRAAKIWFEDWLRATSSRA